MSSYSASAPSVNPKFVGIQSTKLSNTAASSQFGYGYDKESFKKNSASVPLTKIAEDFILQYYSARRYYPESLYRFYEEESLVSMTTRMEDEPVKGKDNIRRLFDQINYYKCDCSCLFHTAQYISLDSVLIMISGELSNNNEPVRRFCEVFTLFKHGSDRFYIKNHLFHFQDEEPSASLSSGGNVAAAAAGSAQSAAISTSTEGLAMTASCHYDRNPMSGPSLSMKRPSMATPGSSVLPPPSTDDMWNTKTSPRPLSQPAPAGLGSGLDVNGILHHDSSQHLHHHKQVEILDPKSSAPLNNHQNASASHPHQQQPSRGAGYFHQHKLEDAYPHQHAHNSHHSPQRTAPRSSTSTLPRTSSQQHKQQQQQPQQHFGFPLAAGSNDEEFVLFVGNLPPACNESDLSGLLEKRVGFGNVTRVSIRNSQMNRKRFAFVELSSKEAMDKILQENSSFILNGQKLIVDRRHNKSIASGNSGYTGSVASQQHATSHPFMENSYGFASMIQGSLAAPRSTSRSMISGGESGRGDN